MSSPLACAVPLGILILSSQAQACWCSDNLSRADAIFSGRVLSVAGHRARVQVLRVFKGRIAGTVAVGTSIGDCAVRLRPGEVRRLSVRRSQDGYGTNVCRLGH